MYKMEHDLDGDANAVGGVLTMKSCRGMNVIYDGLEDCLKEVTSEPTPEYIVCLGKCKELRMVRIQCMHKEVF